MTESELRRAVECGYSHFTRNTRSYLDTNGAMQFYESPKIWQSDPVDCQEDYGWVLDDDPKANSQLKAYLNKADN